jgi:glycosyltransferase involved in cell wall biosynthesis
MRIALIADTFAPLRTSGAVQLRDLAREFARQGHQLTVLLPASDQRTPWVLEHTDGFEVLRLQAPRTKDIGYVRRTLAEFTMPFAMLRHLHNSPLAATRWDGVVWYAPSIFHGPLARALKRASKCKGYLILRDIFPQWAVDMGLMGRGLPYWCFSAIARYQYAVADVIGVQTPGNLGYFTEWRRRPGRRLEVLQNWLDAPALARCPIRVDQTPLAGRKVLVYAGNMGVAQGMDTVLELAQELRGRPDVGFLLVGRGSEVARLRQLARDRSMDNVLFFDEIHPDEIPDLYAQCYAGIVALDHRHKSHNIPGKFLTYMQCGLPVLANVNAGNDIARMIRDEGVGQVCETNRIGDFLQQANALLSETESLPEVAARCRALFAREFAVDKAVRQIVAALGH